MAPGLKGIPRSHALLLCAGLVAATLAVYAQAAGFDFVRFDDPGYVTENARVQAGLTLENVAWAFTTPAMGNWHPLTWLSLMADHQVGGGNAAVFHLTSVVLHVANTLLLFYLLLRMTGFVWRSAFVAVLFAVHPLHVESVAWVSERKDVLSTLFWFLTMLAYLRYVERRAPGRHLLVILLFALGLMSKPMLITLPLVLLLLDFWPLERRQPLSRLLWEKAPLLVLTVASGAVTIYVQSKATAVVSLESFRLGLRVANAMVSYTRYLAKTVWPTGLAIPYPFDAGTLTPWRVSLSVLVLAAVSVLALGLARRRPYLAVGWLWYGITLAPVAGIVQVGSQAMADRYTYVPLVGIFLMIAWGAPDLLSPSGKLTTVLRKLLVAAAGAAVVVLTLCAHIQAARWRDTTTLFTHVLEVTRDNTIAHNIMGLELFDNGMTDAALSHYREAVRISPGFTEARSNLAVALSHAGHHDEAVEHHREVLRLSPGDPDLLTNLGLALMRQGRFEEALARFNESLSKEENPGARKGMGATLYRMGKDEEAAVHLEEAIRLDPADAETHVNLGTVYMRLGEADRAEALFRRAMEVEPENKSAHKNLGVLCARQGRLDEAMEHFSEVLRIDPGDDQARENLGRARRLRERRGAE